MGKFGFGQVNELVGGWKKRFYAIKDSNMDNGNARLYEYKSKTSKKCVLTIKIATIENLRAKGKRKFAFVTI